MAKTFKGATFSICATAQPTVLNQAGYEGLTFVPVGKVGNISEMGTSENILTYNTLDTDVAAKAKGVADAGSPTIEVLRDIADAGQDALRAAALTKDTFAVKLDTNDNESGTTNTIIYNRCVIGGPTRPRIGVEDFDLEVFTLGMTEQREIVVDAT